MKNDLHGRNGPPQRFTFPANDAAGNLDKEEGIEPFRLLTETLKSVKPTVMLGRFPENRLFPRKRPVKRVRLLTAKGIDPVKLLEEMSRRTKPVSCVILAGNSPESSLCCRYKLRR